MTDKNSGFAEYVKPVLVLTVICVVVSALLAFTNSATAPVIEAAELARAEAARAALLPEASGFTEVEYSSSRSVKSVYKSDNGVGYVITAVSGGYGGDVTATVAIHDGKVIGIDVTAADETAGVGTKTAQPDYTDRFKGVESAGEVDVIAGATISSAAVKNAVNSAITAWYEIERGETPTLDGSTGATTKEG